MSSGSPPHGEGDHGSTATDRPSDEPFPYVPPVPPAKSDLRERDSAAGNRRLRPSAGRWRRLGAGLVDVPPARERDPAGAVLPDPVVPEEKRFCRGCGAPVGRGRLERPGPVTGFCPQCGSAFSFVPRLRPREVVAGRYEVVGVLALSSMGATYLAQDRAVNYRWVVLSELADTAIDRRFLAELDHPNIAKAYDLVSQADAGTSFGYLVTEYVGGQSLRELALARLRPGEPLLLAQVLAYGLEILSAVGYLHSQGLRYGDLKPDDVIHGHDQLKLVGLDAVRWMDDTSPASDLYAVGRLLTELSGPLFPKLDSCARLLRRATHQDPARRFGSAEEMAGQLTGVLREVVARETDEPRPGTSTLFGPPIRVFGTTVVPDPDQRVPQPEAAEVVAALPIPQVDPADSAAGVLSTLTSADPAEVIVALADALRDGSIEAHLRRVRVWLDLNDPFMAELALADAEALASPYGWRYLWYRGLVHLASGRSDDARTAFEAVGDQLPGELAPKLALAVSAEKIGAYTSAHRCYDEVWRTDHAYVSAAFGLARMLLVIDSRARTISVLDSIRATSPEYTPAQVAVIKIKIAGEPAEHDLVDAARRLEPLPLAATDRLRLSIAVLEAAYRWVRSEGSRPASKVLGCALTERDLRTGLKQCRRALARQTAGTEPPAPASRWHVFVDGLAESLAPVPPRRRRPRQSDWERIEARIHERYRRLGPPEAAGHRKDGHR